MLIPESEQPEPAEPASPGGERLSPEELEAFYRYELKRLGRDEKGMVEG